MPDPSISGLDTGGIDARDIQHLHDCFRFSKLSAAVHASCRLMPATLFRSAAASRFQKVQLEISSPSSARRGLARLLGSKPFTSLQMPAARISVRKSLETALQLPVPRSRMFADELPRSSQETLFRCIYEKFGEEGHELDVIALYRHIPPECAGSISIESELRRAWFTPGSAAKRRYSAGYYLVILRGKSGKLRRVLFRLDK